VVVDPFHVIADSNRRMDEARRIEQDVLRKRRVKILKKIFLIAGEKLNERRKDKIAELFIKYPSLKACTLINEMLPAIGIDTEVTIMDPDTFMDYLYNPVADKLEIMVYGEDPSPDPWSDWVWQEQVGWGSGGDWWNPSYYDNPRYNQLWVDNSCAKDLETKKEILYEMQDILAEDLPLIYLARADFISAYSTDKIKGWVNEIGGPVSWLNDWSILKVHPESAPKISPVELPEKVEREITEALKRAEAEEAELRWNFNKRRNNVRAVL